MASGRLIDISNFREEDVDLDDIAHHLAKIQRFNGACPIGVTYSVGEHCINLVSSLSERYAGFKILQEALLHDASEAYISDIVSPVKRALPEYIKLEDKIQTTIINKFLFISNDVMNIIGEYDKRILIDEVETIMPHRKDLYIEETGGLKKLGCHIMYNNHPGTVKQCFLTMCKQLGIN